jgi:hypothetical protein
MWILATDMSGYDNHFSLDPELKLVAVVPKISRIEENYPIGSNSERIF